jgi:hypothetical protein
MDISHVRETTMNTACLGRLIDVLVCSALSVLTIFVVLIQQAGIVFFWGEVSHWAFVPPIVTVALLFAVTLRQAVRRILAGTCVLWYLCSVYFDRWDRFVALTAGGHYDWFDAVQPALITVFALVCFLPRDESECMG